MPLVSKRAAITATALVGVHLIAFAYVNGTGMTYDHGGAVGLLWWIVAFLVLPATALIVFVLSAVFQLFDNRNNGGN